MLEILIAELLSTGYGDTKTVVNVPENYKIYFSAYVNDYGDTLSLGRVEDFLDAFNPYFLNGGLCLSRPLRVVPYVEPGLVVYGGMEEANSLNNQVYYSELPSEEEIQEQVLALACAYVDAIRIDDGLSETYKELLYNHLDYNYGMNDRIRYFFINGLRKEDWNWSFVNEEGVPVDLEIYTNNFLDFFIPVYH